MNQSRLASSDLVRLLDEGSAASLSEWQLLQQYLTHRDELAFETLVSRFGPMVLGTCRRMLGDTADVDDAFQATFLVLVRRARSLGPTIAVGAWLHGVAVRVSHQARSSAARRGRWEQPGPALEAADPGDNSLLDAELRQILDEEINRLPWKYRAPVVLCYLEGQTHEGAARQLHWPIGTVKGRLARARSLLESRLTRRGLACGSFMTALAAGHHAQAGVPRFLLATTGRAASRIATGELATHVVSASVARLVQGVLFTMIFQKLKLIALGVAASCLALAGSAALAWQGAGVQPPSQADRRAELMQRARLRKDVEAVSVPPKTPLRPDPDQDRLRKEIVEAARLAYLAEKTGFEKGQSRPERLQSTSRLLMEAERDAAASPEASLQAVQQHRDRMKDMARIVNEEAGADDADRAEARAFLAQAELLAAQAKEHKSGPAEPTPQGRPGVTGGAGKDSRSLAILAKLEEPVAMSFPNETPLEDVLKYIKQATQGSNDAGIPIYVDPLGLQEADKTMTSPVALDLEHVPLRRTLQLALNQLGLGYFVDDGILVITSQDSVDQQAHLPPSRVEPSVFMKKQERFEQGDMDMTEMKDFAAELTLRTQVLKLIDGVDSKSEKAHDEHPPAAKADQLEPLLKEVRELVAQLKAEREAGKKSPAK